MSCATNAVLCAAMTVALANMILEKQTADSRQVFEAEIIH
jgi:hypothetical protein